MTSVAAERLDRRKLQDAARNVARSPQLKSVQFNQESETGVVRGAPGGDECHRAAMRRSPPHATQPRRPAARAAHRAGCRRRSAATRALIDASLDIAARRDPRARGPERLRQVDADQDPRRLPRARPGRASRELDGEPFEPRASAIATTGCASSTRTSGLVARAQRDGQPGAARRLRARRDSGRMRWREQERRPRRVLARFGIDLDIHRPLADGHAGRAHGRRDRRRAAGLARRPRRARPRRADGGPAARRGRAALRRSCARSAARGTSVLYVSHRLDEIFELADRVTVLRGGRVIATRAVADLDPAGARDD